MFYFRFFYQQIKYLCLLLTFVLCPPFINTNAKTIIIHNQKEFDSITSIIKKELYRISDSTLIVELRPGSYYFVEDHLQLKNINLPEKTLIIKGKGVTITARGSDYINGQYYKGSFNVNRAYIGQEGRDVTFWTSVKFMDNLIEIVEDTNGICRFRSNCVQDIDENKLTNSYIRIPSWYLSGTYKIVKILNGYIYFKAPRLRISYGGGYNVNDDYNYGRQKIRFYLCNLSFPKQENVLRIVDGNIYLPLGTEKVHECDACRFAIISNVSLKNLLVTGISFNGNSSSLRSSLIDVLDTRINGSLIVDKCQFKCIKGQVININNSDNVHIVSCCFNDIYGTCILSNNLSTGTKITHNSFNNIGKGMSNSFAAVCSGANYYVNNNSIIDYGYGAIAVGVHYDSDKVKKSYGIIEYNTIYYTPEYARDISNKLMDSGAIYLWTMNDGAIIRYNNIYNVTGVKDNRGIFCDDGARNFRIYGNVIRKIQNSYCIDSRRVKHMEKTIGSTNINNSIYSNIIDGEIRFEGNERYNKSCLFDINYLLNNKTSSQIQKDEIKDVQIRGEKIIIDYSSYSIEEIGLKRKSYNLLKKSSEWKGLKRYIELRSKSYK